MGVDFILCLTPPWKHGACQPRNRKMLGLGSREALSRRCRSRQLVVHSYDNGSRRPVTVGAVSDRSAVEDILHRVNNLLGTIEIQSEVARAVGTPEAMIQALDLIVDSARRTKDELRVLGGKSAD